MKIKILTGCLLLLLFGSCKKSFIELSPKTTVTESNFFITDADYLQAVTGTYTPLHPLYEDAYVMGEMRSDNTHYILNTSNRGGQIVEKENIASFVDVSTNRYPDNKYIYCYQGIAKANAILGRVDAAAISDSSKSNYKGQAEFLRAFYYFELVQYFGGVPLHLKEVTTVGDASLPRSSSADVYKQIISDATDAAKLLPVTQNIKGQVTRGSANTLLAYIYMTQQNYTTAQTVLQAVINSGVYSLLTTYTPGVDSSAYGSIFNPNNKNNTESIFEVQYLSGTSGLQSDWIYQFAPGVTNTFNITGVIGNNQTEGGWNNPTDDLIAAYEPGDTRKSASLALGYKDPDGNYVSQPFIIKYLHPHTVFNNTNDDWMVYRYADVLLLMAECLNEQGNQTLAIPYLNQVRARAGLAVTTAVTQTDLRTAIAKERRVELAFENHRWLDLVRTGQAIPVMNAFGVQIKAKYSYLTADTYNVTQDRLLFPIPVTEIQINSLLTQNPGY